jgi:hypothetical protein
MNELAASANLVRIIQLHVVPFLLDIWSHTPTLAIGLLQLTIEHLPEKWLSRRSKLPRWLAMIHDMLQHQMLPSNIETHAITMLIERLTLPRATSTLPQT